MYNDARYLVGGIIFVPLIMMGTKVLRIDGRNRHEVQMEMRYRASFWERANEFTSRMNNSLMDSVLRELKAEQECCGQRSF